MSFSSHEESFFPLCPPRSSIRVWWLSLWGLKVLLSSLYLLCECFPDFSDHFPTVPGFPVLTLWPSNISDELWQFSVSLFWQCRQIGKAGEGGLRLLSSIHVARWLSPFLVKCFLFLSLASWLWLRLPIACWIRVMKWHPCLVPGHSAHTVIISAVRILMLRLHLCVAFTTPKFIPSMPASFRDSSWRKLNLWWQSHTLGRYFLILH